MTLVASLAGSDQAHKVKLGALGLTSSATGEPGTGSIIFDDPSGSLVVRSWMRVIVTETACTDAPVLFSGWVVKKSISRSDGESTYRDGAARYIDTTLVDANTLLYFRAMFIAAANRPAESEQDRINWLLASDYLADLVIDDGMINSSDTRMLDATDYRKQDPGDLLADLVNSWIYFVYPIQPDGTTFGLFYDTPSSSTGTSTLSISNDLADVTLDSNGNVTGDVFFPQIDAVMEQDGSDIWAREGLTWVGGVTIRDNPTTFATYFDDADLGYRSRSIESDRVKTEATAIAYVNRSLDSHATEDETITVTIRVPAEQVGLVQAGNRMPTKFLHFNDTDFVNRRNIGIEIHQPLVDKYDLTIVLNQRGIPGSGTGGGTGDFPKPPPASPSIVQQASGAAAITLDNDVAGGDTLVVAINSRGGVPVVLPGYTTVVSEVEPGVAGTSQSLIAYKLADGTEGDTLNLVSGDVSGTWYELPGQWTPDQSDTGTGGHGAGDSPPGAPAFAGPITVASNSIVVTASAYGQSGSMDTYSASNDVSTTPGAGWTEDYDSRSASGMPVSWVAHQVSVSGGSVTGSSSNVVAAADAAGLDTTNWAAVVASFTNSSLTDPQPPAPGQVVPWTVVAVTPGSTTSTGTTAWPYAAGSLLIKVDGVLISPASYTETDPGTGDFTLSWVIDSDEVVTCQYIGI